ncbi:MAG: hypothetical protein AB1522_09975 [Chloroflexota bacterium]
MMGRNAGTPWLRRALQALIILLLMPTLVVSAQTPSGDPIQLGKTDLASRGYPDDEGKTYGLGSQGNSVYTSLSWFEDVTHNNAKLAFASAANNLMKDDNSGQVILDGDTLCQSEVSSEQRGCYDVFLQNPLNLMLDSIANPVFVTGFQTDVEGDALFPTLSDDGKYLVFQSGTEYQNFDDSAQLETDIFLAILPEDHDPKNKPWLFRVSAGQTTGGDAFPGADAGFHSGNVDCNPVTYGTNHTTPPACRVHPLTQTAKPNFSHPHPVADVTFIESDGVYVVFESMADLGENSNGYVKDIFLRQVTDDAQTFTQDLPHTLLSRGCDYGTGQHTAPANGDSYHPVFVPDLHKDFNNNGDFDPEEWMEPSGRYIVFVSRATNLDCSIPPEQYPADNPSDPLHRRRANIFLLDRGADLDKVEDDKITLLSKGLDGKPANGASEYPAVTGYKDPNTNDLKLYIAFQSSASNLVADDTNGYTDIFLYEANLSSPASGAIRPISRATGESGYYGEQANAPSYSPAIAGDGRLITFTSYATNLVVGDDNTSCQLSGSGIEGWVSNNCPDIFARRWGVNQTWRVSLTTVGEQAQWNSNFSSLSLNGRYVAFSSGADMLNEGEGVPYQQVYLRDQGNPPGNPNIQPTFYNFGVLPFGQTATKDFRVNYLAELKFLGLEISEGSEYFQIESTDCVPNQDYSADDYCTFTIRFTAPNFSTLQVRGKAKYTVEGHDPFTGLNKQRYVEIGLVGATPVYDVNIPDDPIPTTLNWGVTRTEVLRVVNAGNYVDSFDLTMEHFSGCPFTYTYDPDELTNLQAGEEGTVTVRITATQPNCQDEEANKVILTATSRGDAGKFFQRLIETSSGDAYIYLPLVRK